jgi:hypothetical protein
MRFLIETWVHFQDEKKESEDNKAVPILNKFKC